MTEQSITTTSTNAAPAEPRHDRGLTVFARNPQEMNLAQAQLVNWAERKLAELHEEHVDLSRNHEIADKNGWSSGTLKRQLTRTKKRIEFYEKVQSAIGAGYCIVPNFPLDIFAVRTTREEPASQFQSTKSTWSAAPLPAAQSESPAIGEGRFVSATQGGLQRKLLDETGKHAGFESWVTAFQDIDFPFAFAQPAVLDATQQALAGRFFDEVGVSPQRKRPSGDPMIIGRIYAPRAKRWQRDERCLSFVVAWFLRESDLDFR
jgi:hypothetical protein